MFLGVLLAVICCIILSCFLFLNRFYLFDRQSFLRGAYDTINDAAEEGTLESDAFQTTLRQLTAESSMSILIMDPSGEVIASSGDEADILTSQLFDLLFTNPETTVILETDEYTIQRSEDRFDQGESLLLRGSLSSGAQIMLRITIQSMKESAGIAMQFVLIIGLLFSIIGSVIIYWVSRSITEPILKLQAISKEMTQLHFDVKYESAGGDEIDELGRNMNELSETLEDTIGRLKDANNELQTDLERKEKIDRMRTDFLSNVSHELKTPIALIQGYAEGLRDCVAEDDEESRLFYCDVIMDEADKMNRMVRKLLKLNQIEFGQHEIEMKRFDITVLIRGVLDSMQILLEQNRIRIHFSSAEPVYVWADEYKIEEVLTNYLSNAVNHIGGERNIYVTITPQSDEVRIAVRNNGNPIPEEDIDKIWDKFYKVDKSHSRDYGGSGIGLSIVAAIMAAHHRSYGVLNHEDGVEFWFTLDTEGEQV